MKKLTYSYVKHKFNERGYRLLDTKYINNRTKVSYVCSNNHSGKITYSDFSTGRGCNICGINRTAQKRRLLFNEIKTSFELENFTVFNPVGGYSNVDQKLEFICPNKHIGFISYHNWNAGWRCKECYSLSRYGSGHPMWKGGISFEPYCEAWKDKEYKQGIRNRDGNRCLNPYCDSPNKNDLTLHHIDYNKKNCKPNNLITVCRSCNSKANKDRNWHVTWYKAIIKNRYKFKEETK